MYLNHNILTVEVDSKAELIKLIRGLDINQLTILSLDNGGYSASRPLDKDEYVQYAHLAIPLEEEDSPPDGPSYA